MSSAFHIIKMVFAVGLVVAGTVALWLQPGLVVGLFLGSLAWSHVPE